MWFEYLLSQSQSWSWKAAAKSKRVDTGKCFKLIKERVQSSGVHLYEVST